jgi:hypothetical protein
MTIKPIPMVLIAATLAGSLQAAEPRSGSASATLSVSATVVARAILTTTYQTPTVTVTQADIARGYVDVPEATRLQVRTNSVGGYLLAFESGQPFFTEVQVSGAGARVSLASGNGWVLEPFAGTSIAMELSYRFVLAPGVQPGEYAWPLDVTARTL